MRGRIAALAVVVAMVGVLFAVQGAQVAGADDNDPSATPSAPFLPEPGRSARVQLLQDRPQDRCGDAGERRQRVGEVR